MGTEGGVTAMVPSYLQAHEQLQTFHAGPTASCRAPRASPGTAVTEVAPDMGFCPDPQRQAAAFWTPTNFSSLSSLVAGERKH